MVVSREAMKQEALLRMKELDILPLVRKEFKREDKLYKSENGILYWLEDDEKKMVADWEQETGYLAYHLVKAQTTFGLVYTFLYVTPEDSEWHKTHEDINRPGKAINMVAYARNVSDLQLSDYGYVNIVPTFGGLRRTA